MLNKSILPLAICVLSFSVYSQNSHKKSIQKLDGEFKGNSLFSDETYLFTPNGEFVYREASCGMKSIGKGTYELTRDSLLLFFDSPLEEAIGVFAQTLNTGSNQQSTIMVFSGHKHRNDIQFHYTLYYKDSTIKNGIGNSYSSVSFRPDSVDRVSIATYFKTEDSLVLYQDNTVKIDNSSPYNYVLLQRSDNTAIYLGPLSNKRYKVYMNRSKNGFKIRANKNKIEYYLIPQ